MSRIGVGFVIGGALIAGPASAHHSAAMFDLTKEVTLQGTVKAVEITNPHSWIQVLLANPAGARAEWSVEMANPGTLVRQGFKRSSINAGDKITVRVRPLKDGRPGGLLMSVTTASGIVLPKSSYASAAAVTDVAK